MSLTEITAISLVIFINLTWYSSKFLADENGLKVSWFFDHFLDYKNMFQLMRDGNTERIKRLARIHFLLLIFLPLIFITYIIFILIR